MTRILDLPIVGYPRPPLTLNQRHHWAAASRLRKQLAADLAMQLRAALRGLGARGVTPVPPLTITLEWVVPDRRRRDNDNITPTVKVAADVLCGLLGIDDSWMLVTTATRIRQGERFETRLIVDDARLSVDGTS